MAALSLLGTSGWKALVRSLRPVHDILTLGPCQQNQGSPDNSRRRLDSCTGRSASSSRRTTSRLCATFTEKALTDIKREAKTREKRGGEDGEIGIWESRLRGR